MRITSSPLTFWLLKKTTATNKRKHRYKPKKLTTLFYRLLYMRVTFQKSVFQAPIKCGYEGFFFETLILKYSNGFIFIEHFKLFDFLRQYLIRMASTYHVNPIPHI